MPVCNKLTFAAVAALFSGVVAVEGRAAVLTVNPDLADAEAARAVVGDGGGSASNQTKNGTLLAGAFNTTLISPVFVFQLPALAAGETIESANLDVRVSRAGATAFNADLYGLPARAAAPAVQGGDYFSGALDATDATLIQADQFTPTTSTTAAVVGTSAVGDAALAAYLNAQYATLGAGAYVFLRYSPDFTTAPTATGSLGYAISSAETGAGNRPLLTLTTVVPEPTAGLMVAGVAGLLVGRRRSTR